MKPMRLTFKSGERFYINGAVIRFPKKTTIELLNEAEFLLENHIIQADETTTPLRQLYFIAQMMFTSPTNVEEAHKTFLKFARSLTDSVDHYRLCAGIQEIVDVVNAGNYYEAMKTHSRPLRSGRKSFERCPLISMRKRIRASTIPLRQKARF